MCVFFFLPIHSGHQVRWTYQPGSHRIFHPPSFCGACLNVSREKDSAIPFPHRPRRRILCTNDLIVLHSLGIFIFLFFSEENSVCRDRTHVPTCQKVTRLPLSYRGDRSQRTSITNSRLSLSSTAATLPYCLLLLWSPSVFPSLPGSRLRYFIAMQVGHYSYTSSTSKKGPVLTSR